MHKINLKYLVLFLSLFAINSISAQTTYYVSSSEGNDINDGKIQSKPFKSIAKINSISLMPGDNVLFKSSDVWLEESLIIRNSGKSSNPITFSSYGEGEKPIISSRSVLGGWKVPSNWSKASDADHAPNVWQLKLDCDVAIDRLWIDGIEKELAYDYKLKNYIPSGRILKKGDNGDGTTGVNSTHEFYFDKTSAIFYLYSTSNPATNYSSIIIPGATENGSAVLTTVDIRADYIVIENLDIQGGMYTSLELNGADYLTIDNCIIGKYSNWSGIVGDSRRASDKTSDYITISNCVIDSDWDYNYVFYTQRTPYGILAGNGASQWKIFNNTIKDWWMNIMVVAKLGNVQYMNIFNNDISSLRNTFGKAIQTTAGGTWGTDPKTYVRFYNNYVHDITFGVQLSSKHNYFYGNIFGNLIYKSVNEHGFGGGFASQAISDANSFTPSDNYFFNNTFYNLIDHPHMWDGNSEGVFAAYYANNLYIEVGTDKSVPYRISAPRLTYHYNNIIYSSKFMSRTDKIVYYLQNNTSYTVDQLNNFLHTINDKKVASGNIHHIGSKSLLINNDYTLPPVSSALNSGTDISSLVGSDYKDRWGNLVNRTAPNIGAYGGGADSENNTTSNNNLKVYLESPFKIDKMNTLINQIKVLPSNQPFNSAPWENNNTVSKSNFEDNIVDWLLVELRENQNNITYSKPAVLTDEGIILNPDGSTFHFSNITSGEYYLAVRHRNHLDIMSSEKIKVTNNEPIDYDFTISQNQAYGNNSMVDLGDSKFGMYAGDADGNGIINNLDFGLVANQILQKGYNKGDLDMNGITNVLDYNFINKNILKNSVIK